MNHPPDLSTTTNHTPMNKPVITSTQVESMETNRVIPSPDRTPSETPLAEKSTMMEGSHSITSTEDAVEPTSIKEEATTGNTTTTTGSSHDPEKAAKKPRRKKAKKPKDMPRRPLSAYNLFFREQRAAILEARASKQADEAAASDLFSELGRTIASRWRDLSPENRVKYQNLAEQEMQRYRLQMEEYHLNAARRGSTLLRQREEMVALGSSRTHDSSSSANATRLPPASNNTPQLSSMKMETSMAPHQATFQTSPNQGPSIREQLHKHMTSLAVENPRVPATASSPYLGGARPLQPPTSMTSRQLQQFLVAKQLEGGDHGRMSLGQTHVILSSYPPPQQHRGSAPGDKNAGFLPAPTGSVSSLELQGYMAAGQPVPSSISSAQLQQFLVPSKKGMMDAVGITQGSSSVPQQGAYQQLFTAGGANMGSTASLRSVFVPELGQHILVSNNPTGAGSMNSVSPQLLVSMPSGSGHLGGGWSNSIQQAASAAMIDAGLLNSGAFLREYRVMGGGPSGGRLIFPHGSSSPPQVAMMRGLGSATPMASSGSSIASWLQQSSTMSALPTGAVGLAPMPSSIESSDDINGALLMYLQRGGRVA